MKVIGIVGWKNNGKTTLIERLLAKFTADGFVVSTVKHAHHDFDIDKPGKDSWRHRQAGAHEVLIAAANRWALMHEYRGNEADDLQAYLSRLAPCDLVIVEGFKQHPHDKIEVVLSRNDAPLLAAADKTIVAIATNKTIANAPVPVFNIDTPEDIAAFIGTHLALR